MPKVADALQLNIRGAATVVKLLQRRDLLESRSVNERPDADFEIPAQRASLDPEAPQRRPVGHGQQDKKPGVFVAPSTERQPHSLKDAKRRRISNSGNPIPEPTGPGVYVEPAPSCP